MTRHDMITHGYRIGAAGGKAHEENLGAAMLTAARREGHMKAVPVLKPHDAGRPLTLPILERRMGVFKLCKKGLTNREIAAKLGVKQGRVQEDRNWLAENGYVVPPSTGYASGLVCRTELRRLYEAGLPDKDIAERMGRSRGTISSVRRKMGLMRKVMA